MIAWPDIFFNHLVAYFRKKRPRIIVALFIVFTFIFSALGYFTIPGVGIIERELYDLRVKLSARGAKNANIVILDIDEKSLGELGRWPWSRALMASLNDKLFNHYKITALAYDVVWAERDSLNADAILKQINFNLINNSPHFFEFVSQLRAMDADHLFADSLKNRNVILGYYFNDEKNAVKANQLPIPVMNTKVLPEISNQVPSWPGYTGNLSELTSNAKSSGFFNAVVDPDGVIRRVSLLANYQGNYYASLSLATVTTIFGGLPVEPLVEGSSNKGYFKLEGLNVGPFSVPVAADGTVFVPYAGKSHTYPYYSVSDVLHAKIENHVLENKILILGSSAPGLRDQRATPVENIFPGVEIHANVIDGILNNKIKQSPDFALGLVVFELIILGVLLAFVIPSLNLTRSILFSLLVMFVVVGLNFYLWERLNFILPLALVIVPIILLLITDIMIGYFTEGRLQRNITQLFGQYVPPELVKKMAEDPLKYSMAGRNAILSVLFSDVRGFTSISEKLTATQLSGYINEYLTAMSTLISHQSGTLDKYIGDAIMAFWGAPVPNKTHATDAVKCALSMAEEADKLSASFAARALPSFDIGIGINAGDMRVGDMGSQYRRAYTVMGDPVNLASRLEGLTKSYGVMILVGESIVKLAPEYFYREIDRVKVKGKIEPVTIYTPIGLHDDISDEVKQEVKAWEITLNYYYQGEWTKAISKLQLLIKIYGNVKLYNVYLDRLSELEKTSPLGDWTGVHTFTEK